MWRQRLSQPDALESFARDDKEAAQLRRVLDELATKRARLQEHIEAPPAVFALPPALLVGLAHPDHFIINVPNEPPIAPLSEDDPVYGYMSLQC